MFIERRKQGKRSPALILLHLNLCTNPYFLGQIHLTVSRFATKDLFLWFLSNNSAELQLPKQKPSGSLRNHVPLTLLYTALTALLTLTPVPYNNVQSLLSLMSALQFSNLGAVHIAFMLYNILLIKLEALY